MNKPLHESLTDRLRGMIFGGTYEKGDRLPTEPKLAKELGVSRATLREALKQLESEGAISRVHGLGTFVATTEPSITLDISVPRSVSRLIKSLGLMSGDIFILRTPRKGISGRCRTSCTYAPCRGNAYRTHPDS